MAEFCLRCLDAYAEVCADTLTGEPLNTEMARVADALAALLDADRALLLATVATLNRENRRSSSRLVLPRATPPPH